MYIKIIIISFIVVALWVNVIQPAINEYLFERRMRQDDEEAERKRDCECAARIRKQWMKPLSKKLVVK